VQAGLIPITILILPGSNLRVHRAAVSRLRVWLEQERECSVHTSNVRVVCEGGMWDVCIWADAALKGVLHSRSLFTIPLHRRLDCEVFRFYLRLMSM
jgi:hypothetical protein